MRATRTRMATALTTILWGLAGIVSAFEAPAGADAAASEAGSSRPTPPAARALADQLPCTVDFFEVAGSPAFLIRPKGKTGPSPMPWVWYAPVIGHPNPSHAWMLRQWLAKGIGMAGVDVGESYGSPRGRKVYTALWETLTTRYGMSERPWWPTVWFTSGASGCSITAPRTVGLGWRSAASRPTYSGPPNQGGDATRCSSRWKSCPGSAGHIFWCFPRCSLFGPWCLQWCHTPCRSWPQSAAKAGQKPSRASASATDASGDAGG